VDRASALLPLSGEDLPSSIVTQALGGIDVLAAPGPHQIASHEKREWLPGRIESTGCLLDREPGRGKRADGHRAGQRAQATQIRVRQGQAVAAGVR
jgi:hypothetical protein